MARSQTVVAVTAEEGKEVLLAFRGEEARDTDTRPTITPPSTKTFPAQHISSAQAENPGDGLGESGLRGENWVTSAPRDTIYSPVT